MSKKLNNTSLVLTEAEKELLVLFQGNAALQSEKPKSSVIQLHEESSRGSGPGQASPGGSNKGGMSLRRR